MKQSNKAPITRIFFPTPAHIATKGHQFSGQITDRETATGGPEEPYNIPHKQECARPSLS